jgi:hypothetical protein
MQKVKSPQDKEGIQHLSTHWVLAANVPYKQYNWPFMQTTCTNVPPFGVNCRFHRINRLYALPA